MTPLDFNTSTRSNLFIAICFCVFLLAGCATGPRMEPAAAVAVPAGQAAPACLLRSPENAPESPEPGRVRFTYDTEFLYVHFELTDRDIVADCKQDQQPLYKYGDTVELFLKPDDDPGYWELHVAPEGNRTSIHFPGRSYSQLKERVWPAALPGFRARSRRTAQGWEAVMIIPWREVGGMERKFRILAGRYNYGRELDRLAHSSFPRLPRPAFHSYEQYLPLQLNQQENDHASTDL